MLDPTLQTQTAEYPRQDDKIQNYRNILLSDVARILRSIDPVVNQVLAKP